MSQQAAIEQLAILATGLCQDARVGVELHPNRWAWDPVRKVILVAADELRRHGADYCAGVIAHEVGHFYVSRYVQLGGLTGAVRARATALNAIEDPRVNLWIRKRYPGTDRWLNKVAEQDVAGAARGSMPAFHRFCMECVLEEARGWQPAPEPDQVPEPVAAALRRSHIARRRYAEMTPPGDFNDGLEAPARRAAYVSEVVPRLLSATAARLPDVREQVVRLSAARALALAERAILPDALALLDIDRARVARRLAADDLRTRQARQALAGGNDSTLRAIVDEAMAQDWPASGVGAARRGELAAQVVDEWLRGRDRPPLLSRGSLPAGGGRPQVVVALQPGPSSVAAPAAGRREPLQLPPMPQLAYAAALNRVARQIDELGGRLDALLVPRKRLRSRAGYASGQRLHLRSVMASEADPRLGHRIWSRSSIPDRRQAVFSLLVDLSGSMHGDKSANALLGTVLLAETLHRLRIPFEINGFQDDLIPLCNFSTELNGAARQAISELPREVAGNRPGGRNQAAYNDDGPCLNRAAERLLAETATDRVLIVVSDGQPAGLRSGDDELLAAVARLRGEPLELIGIGLGPDTGHVRRFYDDAIANVPVGGFAEQIGDLLARVLLR